MKKILLIILTLSLLIFTGCTEAPDYEIKGFEDLIFNTKTFYEKNLELGNVFVTDYEVTILGGDTIYIAGISQNDSISMYKRVARAYSNQDIDIDIKLYEDGTQYNLNSIDSFNKNRNSNKTTTFTIYEYSTNPASIIGATELPFSNKLKGDKQVVVSSLDTADYIMKQNTTYILEITNNALQPVNLILYWNWIKLFL